MIYVTLKQGTKQYLCLVLIQMDQYGLNSHTPNDGHGGKCPTHQSEQG